MATLETSIRSTKMISPDNFKIMESPYQKENIILMKNDGTVSGEFMIVPRKTLYRHVLQDILNGLQAELYEIVSSTETSVIDRTQKIDYQSHTIAKIQEILSSFD